MPPLEQLTDHVEHSPSDFPLETYLTRVGEELRVKAKSVIGTFWFPNFESPDTYDARYLWNEQQERAELLEVKRASVYDAERKRLVELLFQIE